MLPEPPLNQFHCFFMHDSFVMKSCVLYEAICEEKLRTHCLLK